jgi:hypothetical protein
MCRRTKFHQDQSSGSRDLTKLRDGRKNYEEARRVVAKFNSSLPAIGLIQYNSDDKKAVQYGYTISNGPILQPQSEMHS